ncbi:hypothetical protein BJF83_03205 [Nocardiopsis sp. CNR-923]|uniref:hypothetical protein n=1 Tax=Nocardiopsis sp. CNR-923 TaxID=1904965 RepID=UPI00095C15CC|nr:hypothetical protein BJF83_03205 [Nocardiopsis sp. CNR-923]
MAPREEPRLARQSPNIRSYPDGYDPNRIGTFPKGCPVPHGLATVEVPGTGAHVPAPGQAIAPAAELQAPVPRSEPTAPQPAEPSER